MLTFGIICALVATASAGYASSGAGGYSSVGAAPYVPVVTPFDIQQYIAQLNAFQANPRSLTTGYAGEGAKVQSYASLSPSKRYQDRRNNKNNKNNNLWYQNLAQQAAIQNSVAANINAIRDQALYGNRFGYGGYGAGGGAFAGSGASTGSYGGVGGGSTYGGSYNNPGYATPVVNRFGGGGGSYSSTGHGGYSGGSNYAASGGSVGGGHQTGFAHVSPPRLDSRFGDEGVVTHSVGTPGFSGVSSFSSSSDINGVRNRESGTSVNNNGKVTTYYNRGS